jgi:hypothetical protein
MAMSHVKVFVAGLSGRLSLVLVAIALLSGLNAQEPAPDTLITEIGKKEKAEKKPVKHNPATASILAIAVPGAGQIYNRKYWKAPLVWGGLGVCGYFLVDNHLSFIEFRDAYRERVGGIMNPAYDFYPTEGLKAERDQFQRNRDFMAIIAIGVYVFSIIDATVDGHLFHFDVSDDLSMRVEPASLMGIQGMPAPGIRLTLSLR